MVRDEVTDEIKKIIREALHRGQSTQRWYRPDIFKVDENIVNKTTAQILDVLKRRTGSNE